MFTQSADYAFRAVAHLAVCRERATTVPQMAEAIGVNAPYLRKVIKKLGDAEIVDVQRGSGGGITLVSDPRELTLLDVLNAVSPVQHFEGCPLGLPEHVRLCGLHAELEAAICHVEEVLASRSIAELIAQRRSSAQCKFPYTTSCR